LEQGVEENIEPKRDEVAGGWRKLHNEELHNLYSSPSIIRMIKSASQEGLSSMSEWTASILS
jgi:hypothetical protein